MTEADEGVRLSDLVFPAYREAWNSKDTYRLFKGSKGSGKSKFAALWHVYHMMKYADSNVVVFRKTYNSLRDSVFADLLWAIDKLGVGQFWTHTLSPLQLTYKDPNRKHSQVILMRGLDDPLKIASIAVPTGHLCWVWFEEASQIMNYEDYLKITMSIRGDIPPETGLWKSFMFTFNPWSAQHWLKTEFFDKPGRGRYMITTTYKDNLGLGRDDIERYEELRVTSPHAARVICDGDWGMSEGLIYDNWVTEEFSLDDVFRDNPNAVPIYGLDFGFAVSYTAFVAAVVDYKARRLWVYDEWYARHVSNLEIAKAITEKGYGGEQIWGDAAAAQSIYELRNGCIAEEAGPDGKVRYERYQLPGIKPAVKGADSVMRGIRELQSFRMIIHPRCVNMEMELNNYVWDVDKDGVMLDKPVKEFDHLCDALRYAFGRFLLRGKGLVAEAKGGEAPSEGRRSIRVASSMPTGVFIGKGGEGSAMPLPEAPCRVASSRGDAS